MSDKYAWILEEFSPDYHPDPQVAIDLAENDVIAAEYATGSYEGEAAVLLRNQETGTLYIIEASHCSCFGLEGQWKPAVTHRDVLSRQCAHEDRWRVDQFWIDVAAWLKATEEPINE